ncbi:hypothetical protein SAMN05518871_105290 [Psychrobacillus sp. OK028]|uniref:hypothetical protein n=1 Tax=Psychrobacillus sp. OK028 TaxID=1884359 RepID=UPI00088A1F7D|nr:hypothetical protein [Psychrobacillus sp. OK028]SDN50130.1 hypothetical protein SAMN05518871_105290 [Psychrobacillus sp. OK028]
MYIENIRVTIKSLPEERYEEFLTKLRKNLIYKYDTKIKPSELKIQVEKFLDSKTDKISIRYLEGYLLTLNDLSVNGGLKAILQGRINTPSTWRDLLIIATEDRPLPKVINREHLDNILIKEIKLLFTNVLTYCAHENKEKLQRNVHKVNDFLTIRMDLD